jgi:protein-glutamine gamma-glutamyltransferase
VNLFRFLRGPGRAWPAEHSVALRAAAAGAVCVAVAACVGEGELPLWLGAVTTALVCAGGVFSYRRRTRPFPHLKVFLGAAVIGAFAWFFVSVSADAASGQLSAVEAPLAVLFAAMQAAHAFDMPSRRDLGFSLAGSATLMAVAGAQAIDFSFALYVAIWALLALAGLHAAWSSMAGGRAPRLVPVAASSAAAFLVAALLVAFLPAPHPPSPPAASAGGPNAATTSELARIVASPAVAQSRASASGPTGVGGFLGFAGQLDTALRAGLGDDVVLRVRADRPTYWVAETFDSWSGRSWNEAGPPRTATRSVLPGGGGQVGWALITGGPPFVVAPGVVSPVGAARTGAGVTSPSSSTAAVPAQPDFQTFYLAASVSNLVLHADQATAVWLPTRRLYVGANDTIRTSETLGAGSVYSVESTVATPSDATLEKANGTAGLTPTVARQDLELPRSYPRVAALARRITAHDTTVISKIVTIERWIGGHTRYTLDIPPLASGQDTVVQFLFGTRRGFCEQISTSLAVMLRTLGIPAREAVGYVPGSFDPITGLYDERAKDAHAWVQVWFPDYGWQNFDPTAYVPTANPSAASTIGHDLVASLRRVPVAPTASVVSVLAVAVLVIYRRRRRPRTWSARVTRELERAARSAGVRTKPGATLGSLAGALDTALDGALDGALDDGDYTAPDTAPDETRARRPSAQIAGPPTGPIGEGRRASHLAAVAAAAAWGDGHDDLRRGAGRHYVRDARRLRRAARHRARHRASR